MEITNDTHTLYCLIEGEEDEPFEVQISDVVTVGRLKQRIYRDGISVKDNIVAKNLKLWKLHIPVPLNPIKNFPDRLPQSSELSEHAVELLNPTETLSVIFPQNPPNNHLSIIVRVSHGSTISPSSSGSSNDNPQTFMDEATATWNAWWGKPLDVKLKTIQLPEAVNQDDMDIDDTLPSSVSIRYLDMENTMRKAPALILVREEYDVALDYLKVESTASGGIAILGNPGIGKTCFLWYILRCRLRDKLPTIFTMDSDPSILFSANGASNNNIYEAVNALRPEKVWSLFDLGLAVNPPDATLWKGVFGVQTTSPQVVRYKGWIKEIKGQIWTMNPWSFDEIVMGLTLQPNLAVIDTFDHDLLATAFAKYGPIPRSVYVAYGRKGRDKTYDQILKSEIKTVTPEVLGDLVNLAPINALMPVSHKIMSVQRDDDDVAYGTVLSQFVLGLLMHASSFRTLDSKRKLCELLAGVPHAGVTRGWCFEAYSHAMLTEAPDGDVSHSIPTLATSGKDTGIRMVDPHGQSLDYVRMYRKAVVYESAKDFATLPASDGKYYIPTASNNPCFDSFTIIGAEVWIFQMTVSESHNVDTPKQKGLELLKKILPSHLSWRYILVVPKSASDPLLTNVPRKWEEAVKSFHVMRIEMTV